MKFKILLILSIALLLTSCLGNRLQDPYAPNTYNSGVSVGSGPSSSYGIFSLGKKKHKRKKWKKSRYPKQKKVKSNSFFKGYQTTPKKTSSYNSGYYSNSYNSYTKPKAKTKKSSYYKNKNKKK